MATIPTTCSECDHTVEVPEQHAGKRLRCPSCQHVMRVPELATDELVDEWDEEWDEDEAEEVVHAPSRGRAPAPRSGRRRSSEARSPGRRAAGRGLASRPPLWKRLATSKFVWAVVVLLALAPFFPGGSDSYFEHAESEIRKTYGDTNRAEIMVAVAKTQHRDALSAARQTAGTNARGRRQTSRADYLTLLGDRMAKEMALLTDTTTPSEDDFLEGYWELVGLEQRTAVQFLPGGRYEQVFALAEDLRYEAGKDPRNRDGGEWSINGEVLTWKSDESGKLDPNPVLLYSERGMILKEAAGYATYWRHHKGRGRGPF